MIISQWGISNTGLKIKVITYNYNLELQFSLKVCNYNLQLQFTETVKITHYELQLQFKVTIYSDGVYVKLLPYTDTCQVELQLLQWK